MESKNNGFGHTVMTRQRNSMANYGTWICGAFLSDTTALLIGWRKAHRWKVRLWSCIPNERAKKHATSANTHNHTSVIKTEESIPSAGHCNSGLSFFHDILHYYVVPVVWLLPSLRSISGQELLLCSVYNRRFLSDHLAYLSICVRSLGSIHTLS